MDRTDLSACVFRSLRDMILPLALKKASQCHLVSMGEVLSSKRVQSPDCHLSKVTRNASNIRPKAVKFTWTMSGS